jgi:uncharacterized membrane protein (Fun14 family)
MVYQSGTDTEKTPALKHAIKSMPHWKWRLLTFGLVIGMIGVAGQAYTFFSGQTPPANAPAAQQTTAPQTTAARSVSPAPPVGSSGFVGGQTPAGSYPQNPPTPGANPQATPVADSSQAAPPDYSQLWKPFMTKVGFSLFVGIFVGVLFRAFFRIAMLISLLIVGAAMGLSYFHILNVDLTSVKTETAQATNWLADQGYRLKDMLFHALPSSTSAGIGFILGCKRR